MNERAAAASNSNVHADTHNDSSQPCPTLSADDVRIRITIRISKLYIILSESAVTRELRSRPEGHTVSPRSHTQGPVPVPEPRTPGLRLRLLFGANQVPVEGYRPAVSATAHSGHVHDYIRFS